VSAEPAAGVADGFDLSVTRRILSEQHAVVPASDDRSFFDDHRAKGASLAASQSAFRFASRYRHEISLRSLKSFLSRSRETGGKSEKRGGSHTTVKFFHPHWSSPVLSSINKNGHFRINGTKQTFRKAAAEKSSALQVSNPKINGIILQKGSRP